MNRILVANRGEIARRVIATCHRLGLDTVAVCSDPDLDAPHVREAGTAVRLPGAAAADTYLRGDLLVAAALRAGADAVHPGYGFGSENAGFAQSVIDAGLTWIGPSPAAIGLMGDKIQARRLAAAAGAPVLAALEPDGVTDADLPVLVKASAGGGGRGMRIVRCLDGLPAEIKVAESEAEMSFGNSTVFIEPYVEGGHHVEVQVMADRHGTTVVLGERECSIQRRHQKVVEESPSPLASRVPGLRDRLGAAALAVARAVGYTGAGTVEFLAVPDGRFWFLEMNTRLQVEHPVTECVTGLDLVELQLLVAAGGRLPPAAPGGRGAAIEARLYAEDPALDWRPATGVLHRFDVPASQAPFTAPVLDVVPRGTRLDAGVCDGAVIGVHYDPMLAKVIAWAPTRLEAAASLARVLAGARIHGPRTNRDLLVRVLRDPAFAAGNTDTAFLNRGEPSPRTPAAQNRGEPSPQTPAAQNRGEPSPRTPAGVGGHDLTAPLLGRDDERLAAVAAALADAARRRAAAAVLREVPSGWRNVPASPQRSVLAGPGGEHVVEYRSGRDGVTVEGAGVLTVTPERVVLEAGGVVRRFDVARYPDDDRVFVDGDAGSVVFTEVPRFPEPAEAGTEGSLRAPLPGTVVAVRVAVGDVVEPGQELLVIEAMKMQHVVCADRAGRVESLGVEAGRTVDVGATLVVIQ
jgi:acyl-CoA carboxylase subunit alpha